MEFSTKDKWGFAIFAGVFVVAVTIFVAPLFITKIKIDDESLCPEESLYGQLFFLVDTTDALNAREQRNLIEELQSVKDSLSEFDRLSIYLISEEIGGLSDPLFDKCMPPTGENVSRFTETQRLVRRKYDKTYGDKLKQIMKELADAEAASRSPIIEALADVANKIRRQSDQWSSVKVYVFSDLMQHTQEWSHYSGSSSLLFENFVNSRYGQSMMMDFGRTQVEMLYLVRPKTQEPTMHRQFWIDLLNHANANWKWVPIS